MRLNKLTSSLVLSGLMIATVTNGHAGVVTTDGADVVINTKGGFEAKTTDGQFKFKVGGYLQFDYDFYNDAYNAGNNDTASDSEIRRARIAVEGTVYKDWQYKLELNYDDATDKVNLGDDAYIKYSGWDFAYIKVGKFKVPFGLEELTSSKNISTIERAAMYDIIRSGPSDRSLELGGAKSNFTWRAGIYETGRQDDGGFNDLGFGARITYAPILDEENHQVLHLGLAYLNENVSETFSNKWATRFGVHTASKATLATAKTEDQQQVGVEAAYVHGPFSVQGEYVHVSADGNNGDQDLDFDTGYVQATYTITGESRPYDKKSGTFSGIKPKGQYGAWEVVARYERGDVSTDNANDPNYDVYVLGLNWYANSHVRVGLDYVHTNTDEVFADDQEDSGNAVTTRLQLVY